MPALQPSETLAMLHRFLGIGLAILSVTALALAYAGIVPLMPRGDGTALTAYIFAAVVSVLLAIAIFVLRPRVPSRQPGQSMDAYWSTPLVASRALLVWFLLEGSGVLALVGFLVSGESIAAVASVASVAAYWMCGPTIFARP